MVETIVVNSTEESSIATPKAKAKAKSNIK